MKNRNFGLYAVALAIVVVGALWAGLPVGTLATFGLILVCPLMMFFMMRGMHGGQDSHGSQDGQGHQDDDSAGRPGAHDHSGMR
jgi:hypothetical protein